MLGLGIHAHMFRGLGTQWVYLKFGDAVGVYQPQLKRLLEYFSIKERYGGPDCKGILERLRVQGSRYGGIEWGCSDSRSIICFPEDNLI